MSRFLDAWVRLMLRHRLKTLVGILLITAFAGFLGSRLEIRTALLDMIKKGSPRAEVYEAMRERFGGDTVMLIGIDDPKITTPEGIERLRKLSTLMLAEPLIVDVSSIVDLQRIDPDAGTLKVKRFFPEGAMSQGQIDNGIKALREDGLFVPTFLADDGTATAVLAELASDLASTREPEVRAALEAWADTQPGGRNLLKSDSGILSLLESARMGTAMRVIEMAEAAGFAPGTIHATGMPVSAGFLLEETERHMGPFFGFTLIVIAILLTILLHSFKATIFCLIVAMPAVLWAVGFGGTINGRISIVAAMAPMIVLVLSVANVVHLVGQFRFDRARRDQQAAIISAFHEVGSACFLTSLTTLIGFSSLRFIPLATAQELGVVCAVGVVAAFILTFTIVPVLLSFFDLPPQKAEQNTRLFPILDWCQSVARRTPKRVIAGSALLTAIAIGGMKLLVIDTNLDAKFYDEHPVAQAAAFFNERLSGGVTAEVLVDTGRPGGALERDLFVRKAEAPTPVAAEEDALGEDEFGIDDAEGGSAEVVASETIDKKAGAEANSVLVRLEKASKLLTSFRDPEIMDGGPVVMSTFSLADIAKRTHRAMGGETDLPNRAQLAAQLALFESEGGEGLSSFVDDERRYVRMTLRMPSLGTRNAVAFMKAVEPELQTIFSTPDGGIPTQINGIDILLADIIEALGLQLYVGFGFAALVITMVMALVYRSWRVGLASMLPNVLPVISGIGILGLMGLKIDVDALFMVSIALGIAVDDTIHFLTRYKLEREAGVDRDEAVKHSLHETGVGIVRTSVILVLGFGVFALSPYLTFKYVGLILPTTMLMAVIADMLVIPAMVYLDWIPVVDEDPA